MNKISLKCFLNAFHESCDNEGRYCFILGAGASKESGIPTGYELAKKWRGELKKDNSDSELSKLLEDLNMEESQIEVSSKNYFNIYDIRFYPIYQNGYAYIQRIMENAQPSYGYYPLAMQLANERNNLVITTNFDCMVEDSLFTYTGKRPIVVGHELLANYIDINSKRPIVAKIHRGLYFEPFNRRKDLASLSEKWRKVLKTSFEVYTPIMIGYAGGDNTLMDFLNEDSVELNGLYWLYYKDDEPSDEIKELVKKNNGYFVSIDGFDSMMFTLSEKFEYENPSERITDFANQRVELYQKAYEKFSSRFKAIEDPDENQSEVIDLLENANDRGIRNAAHRTKQNPKEVSAHIDLATSYYYNEDYKKAIESYTNAITLQPENARAYSRRAQVYGKMEEYEKAIADYSKAIELKPEDADEYINRGITHSDMEEYEKAIADYSKAIELNSQNADAYNNRGISYNHVGEYDKALADYSKAIELNPEFSIAHNNRGITYRKIVKYDEAMEDYGKAIELNPAYADAYNNRGYLYHKIEELDKALEDANKAIELNQNLAEAYDTRSNIHYDMKEYDKAITDINKAIELKSNLEEPYRTRAKVFEALGEKDKAKADIKKADENKNKGKSTK